MSINIFIIAHAPLAHALRECALHVFADCGPAVAALDVQPHVSPEETLALAHALLERLGPGPVLILTDVFGATPCNIAQRLIDGVQARLIAASPAGDRGRATFIRRRSRTGSIRRA